MNRRIIGLSAAFLLAAIGTLTIVGYVRGADNRARDGQKTVDVLVVQQEIPAGTAAKDIGSHVKREAIVKQVEADGAITDLKTIQGQVSNATLVPGEQLVAARFVTASLYRATTNGVVVPAGLLQTTLALDPERALGGMLTPGMRVAVTASVDDKNSKPAATQIVAQQVLVTNVQMAQTTGSSGFTPSSADNSGSSGSNAKPGNAPSGRMLVTLALDAPTSQTVLFAAERGSLWLSAESNDQKAAPMPATTRETLFK